MENSSKEPKRQISAAYVTGVGLILGVVASAMTGQWWFVAVGLVLGAGIGNYFKR